jgi:hypothetical protein
MVTMKVIAFWDAMSFNLIVTNISEETAASVFMVKE